MIEKSLLWVPWFRCAQWSCQMELLFKQIQKNNNQTYIHRGQGVSKLAVVWKVTEPKQTSIVVVCWNTNRIHIGLI